MLCFPTTSLDQPMPPQVQTFLSGITPFLYMLVAVWLGGNFLYSQLRRYRKGFLFPAGDILYGERFITGRSHGALTGRLGNGGCPINVAITAEELWTGPPFPFSTFAAFFDLDHRIARTAITNIELVGAKTLVSYRSSGGIESKMELHLRNPTRFIEALE